ncbi:MAG: DUF116 domain-containing protein [Deltaproteobacteria bacterium]|jgi:uncharacterized protein|nr:DUF116 domain-containing protein [Deltaproteobacteria bacterium]
MDSGETKKTSSENKRVLGDEWENWNGADDSDLQEGNFLFLITAASVVMLLNIALCVFVYLISPRLTEWHVWIPTIAWVSAFIFIAFTLTWFLQFALTISTGKDFLVLKNPINPIFDLIFNGTFRVAKLFGISRDRMGHSFVRSYNRISKATKPKGRKERLLILLPRCLAKEQLKEITSLKNLYPIHIKTVSGGELARKHIKELMPSAVIGVACERDLVSGIRDVGKKLSLIGIPNKRPDGPCKNTHIDMKELISAIEFYVGPPSEDLGSQTTEDNPSV